MEFKYQAQDKNGKVVSAVTSAQSASALVLNLKNQGLLPLNIKEIKAGIKKSFFSKQLFLNKRVTLKELAVFSRQLSSSMASGIPLIEALYTICEDLENRYFRNIIEHVIDDINSGSNFSSALEKYSHVFSPIFLALIKAGESSGGLDRVSADLAKYLENMDRIISKIKSSVRYPIFIVSFLIFVVGIMVIFIVPKFTALFTNAKVTLPLLTRMVVGFSEFVIANILWIIIAIVAAVILYPLLLKVEKIKYQYDKYKLRLPIFGKIIQKAVLLRFSRTLGILLSGGVGLVTALPICSNVVNNLYLKKIIEDIKNNITAGAVLSNELKNYKVFPRMFVKMVQVGEKTGKISDMLSRNADYYEEELMISLNDLTSMIEPILIVIIGGIVLVVLLALYLPIFKMSAAIR